MEDMGGADTVLVGRIVSIEHSMDGTYVTIRVSEPTKVHPTLLADGFGLRLFDSFSEAVSAAADEASSP